MTHGRVNEIIYNAQANSDGYPWVDALKHFMNEDEIKEVNNKMINDKTHDYSFYGALLSYRCTE